VNVAISGPEASNKAHYFEAGKVEALTADLFAAAGLPREDAQQAANILVAADLRGVWSHGVARVPMYLARVRNGTANAKPNIRIQRVMAAAALVDGDNGLGLVVAPKAMAESIDIAKAFGIGIAGVKRSGHFATTAYYTGMATAAGCMGFVYTNASKALPPWGAQGKLLGTSPFGFAAPAPKGQVFQVDMAMSRVARGKLKFAAERGDPIPEGYALDKDGKPTTDGKAAFEGTMLPFGEYKGAALSWMMDVLGGVFTGAAFAGDVANPFTELTRSQNTGHVFIAVKADMFVSRAAFDDRMGELDQRAKSMPTAQGFAEILSPGEPEARREAEHRAKGIPLTPNVVAALQAEAATAAVAWPF
jgi:LDH2 family malate/lactate/ureidoglycolate dehydrogenase